MRTTARKVQAIIDVDTDIDVMPFIETASSLVTEICVPAGYDDARLELIERWLAGHFYAIRDPRMQSQGFGGANGSMQGQTAMHFQGTSYGQQALLLDTAGGLARLSEHIAKGKRGKIGMVSLARDSSKDPDTSWYGDR